MSGEKSREGINNGLYTVIPLTLQHLGITVRGAYPPLNYIKKIMLITLTMRSQFPHSRHSRALAPQLVTIAIQEFLLIEHNLVIVALNFQR